MNASAAICSEWALGFGNDMHYTTRPTHVTLITILRFHTVVA